ncbi:hypothetical protein KUTeg_016073 [Tegillarca granosa]|uniref:Uncharacterized protein n=1 Tax=Tegillarca granosa TaxID=220873 RepID=A0ABQ9EJT5_TEGGR|nr:hypothetical protein KUTeg_016073 [Tegillarca granosa]
MVFCHPGKVGLQRIQSVEKVWAVTLTVTEGDDSVTECVDEGNTVEVYNSMNVAGAKWNQRLSANDSFKLFII